MLGKAAGLAFDGCQVVAATKTDPRRAPRFREGREGVPAGEVFDRVVVASSDRRARTFGGVDFQRGAIAQPLGDVPDQVENPVAVATTLEAADGYRTARETE